jgi:hypothetical protein
VVGVVDEQQLLEVQQNESNNQLYTTIPKTRFDVDEGQYILPVLLGQHFPVVPAYMQVYDLLDRIRGLLRKADSTATEYAVDHGTGPGPEEMGYVNEAVAEISKQLGRAQNRLDEEYNIVESPEEALVREDGAPSCPVCEEHLRPTRKQVFTCRNDDCALYGRRLTMDTLELVHQIERGDIEIAGEQDDGDSSR